MTLREANIKIDALIEQQLEQVTGILLSHGATGPELDAELEYQRLELEAVLRPTILGQLAELGMLGKLH